MTLETVDYAFFPFKEESKEFYRSKYSLPDIFTEQALDIAVKRIKNGVLADKNRNTTYSQELQFKSYICAKALLTEMDNPVYTYLFFKSEAEYLIQEYPTKKLVNILDVPVESVKALDPDVLMQSSLSENISQFDPDVIGDYTRRFYNNIETTTVLLQSDEPRSRFKGMFRKARDKKSLFKFAVEDVVDTETVSLQGTRVHNSRVYFSETKTNLYVREKLVERLSEKYPNPVADVTIDGESLEEILQQKVDFCIAQLPKITYESYDMIQVEYLPPSLQSMYMRICSNPSLLTEKEYEVLFHTLYKLGFTKTEIIELFSVKTELGRNYLKELLSDSNVSRTDSIESWEEVEEIVSSSSLADDMFKSVTRNPVEYYRLRAYME